MAKSNEIIQGEWSSQALKQVAADLREAGADLCKLREGIAAIATHALDACEFAFEVSQSPKAAAFFVQMPEGAAEQIVHFLVRMFWLAHLFDESAAITCQHHGPIVAAQAFTVINHVALAQVVQFPALRRLPRKLGSEEKIELSRKRAFVIPRAFRHRINEAKFHRGPAHDETRLREFREPQNNALCCLCHVCSMRCSRIFLSVVAQIIYAAGDIRHVVVPIVLVFDGDIAFESMLTNFVEDGSEVDDAFAENLIMRWSGDATAVLHVKRMDTRCNFFDHIKRIEP